MRRLVLALMVVAVPALGEGLDDGGATPPEDVVAPLETDAGVSQSEAAFAFSLDGGLGSVEAPPGVAFTPLSANHHFSIVVDSEPTTAGRTDAQLWLTPRWDRVDPYTAVDLRAGMTQGLSQHFALGLYVDATPMATGVLEQASIDARATAMGHFGAKLNDVIGLGAEVTVSGGLNAVSFAVTGIADAQLGKLRLGLNLDGWTDARWNDDGSANSRFRQTLGLGYTLGNGFSISVEFQSRQSWRDSDYLGAAFLIGPSLGYRSQNFWVAPCAVAAGRGAQDCGAAGRRPARADRQRALHAAPFGRPAGPVGS